MYVYAPPYALCDTKQHACVPSLGYTFLSLVIVIALTTLIAVFRLPIERWIQPRADSVRKYVPIYNPSDIQHQLTSPTLPPSFPSFPASWVFAIMIVFVLSFPPVSHQVSNSANVSLTLSEAHWPRTHRYLGWLHMGIGDRLRHPLCRHLPG